MLKVKKLKSDKRENKKDRIKLEATRLFAERGVDAVSVRDIAAVCDMEPPNLYAHFKSLESLIAELFYEGYADYGKQLSEIALIQAPFRVKLDKIVRLICYLYDYDNLRFRFLIMTQHGYIRSINRDEKNPVEVICRTIQAAMDCGEIPNRESEIMSLAVIGILVQAATGMLYGRITGTLSERADMFVDMCWRALS